MKKYTNDNIFLNSLNDITRSAYKVDNNNNNSNSFNNDLVITREMNSNNFVMNRDAFDAHNSNANDLHHEILTLKNKLKIIYEKDEEISTLNSKISDLKAQINKNNDYASENATLNNSNIRLRRDISRLQSDLVDYNKLHAENINLKKVNKKLLDSVKTLKSQSTPNPINNESDNISHDKTMDLNNDKTTNLDITSDLSNTKIDITDKYIDDIIDDKLDETSDIDINSILSDDDILDNTSDNMLINIDYLKSILITHLKSYHEMHINSLLKKYNISNNQHIHKDIITKLLIDAIHI